MTEKKDAEAEKKDAEVEKVDESELVPDPGYPSTDPTPRPLTEEEQEQRRKEKEEAEDAAREAAEEQPEDPSVEVKARNPVRVNKQQFETEWPTVQHQFPGVEPEFGKEEDGNVELLNVQAPAMAYAAHSPQPVDVSVMPERTQHGWGDYVDNSRPSGPVLPRDEGSEDDIEATPKRRRQQQQKVSTRT